MRTPKILSVTAVLLSLSMSTPSADTAESGAKTEDAVPTKSIIETSAESQDSRGEPSAALAEASPGVSEAVVELVEVLRQRLRDGPLADYITEDLVSENESIIEKYDSDGDGGLSKQELAKGLEEQIETEKYQSLTPEERRNGLEEEFKEMDLDEDLKISLEEMSIFMAETIYIIESAAKVFGSRQPNVEDSSSSNETENNGHSN